jgi:hypothetical protein
LLSATVLAMVHEPHGAPAVESPRSAGWIVDDNSTGGLQLRITGANPGLQAGLVVYPEHDLVITVLSNTWGIGSRDAEMVNVERFAHACMGWSWTEDDDND